MGVGSGRPKLAKLVAAFHERIEHAMERTPIPPAQWTSHNRDSRWISFTLLLLVGSCLYEAHLDCALWACDEMRRHRSHEFWNFPITILVKKGCFPTFEREKLNFSTLAPPWKNLFGCLWKYPLLPPTGENPSDAHVRWWLELYL